MSEVIREGAVRVGVDLAKRVIQVHAVDSGERVLTSRALARDKFLAWCTRRERPAAPRCRVPAQSLGGLISSVVSPVA